MKQLKLLFLLALVGSLAACSGTPKKSLFGDEGEAAQETSSSSEAETTDLGGLKPAEQGGSVEVIGANEGLNAEGQALDGQSLSDVEGQNLNPDALGKTYEPVIYFDYDQFSVNDDNLQTIKHYANILLDNPEQKIRLVGHTDERGTPEYNLALGERRAKAVAEAFMLYGVSNQRMEVITMGEEQPQVDGHDEAAWAKNRRVEMLAK